MRTLGEENDHHSRSIYPLLTQRHLTFTITGSFLRMLQSCSSSPRHTLLLQSQSFSKDSYLKESRRQEDQLHFIESTCFQRGKLFILSTYVCVSFIYFQCHDFLFLFLDTSRRFPPGGSLSYNQLSLLPGIPGVRSGGYTLYTVVTGLYALPVYVQHPLFTVIPLTYLKLLVLLGTISKFPSSFPPIKKLTYPKVCGIKTIVANGIYASSSVFDPSILSWITSFFVLTIVTQIAATTLIAGRIYAASQPFQISGEIEHGYGVQAGIGNVVDEKKVTVLKGGMKYEPTQREKYLATIWLVVESGFIYSSAAIVQLVTYLLQMNAGVIMELVLSQLSVSGGFFFLLPYNFFF